MYTVSSCCFSIPLQVGCVIIGVGQTLFPIVQIILRYTVPKYGGNSFFPVLYDNILHGFVTVMYVIPSIILVIGAARESSLLVKIYVYAMMVTYPFDFGLKFQSMVRSFLYGNNLDGGLNLIGILFFVAWSSYLWIVAYSYSVYLDDDDDD